ncbi:lamin tail domain-containing protein [Chitinophaga varians]|uniref:lamin tail domain-containing protein n=1 Tax=Chitinophaga varians TaxID=2202339 RepID=UPI00165F5F97|nr:lamin tail domain-containing protein [Chitinophaga varians]MBC9911179.1 lamin tail domain-containing protein [Chitinophaga varians]
MNIPIVCIALLWQVAPGRDTAVSPVYDVVIHEMMIKPSPSIGLPPFEYIELRNRSSKAVQLQRWTLAVNKREVTLPSFLLQPDSLLVLCSPAAGFAAPNVLQVDRFPALPDDTGQVVLYNHRREVIHAVAYTPAWYGLPTASQAGRSLEMLDPSLPCSGKINWMASTSPAGGTPGGYNAAARRITDDTRPDLYFIEMPDSLHLLLHFSKTLDSLKAASPVSYQVSTSSVAAVTVLSPLFNIVALQLASAADSGAVVLHGISDCAGNESGIKNSLSFIRPQPPVPGDLVINELLFDPPAGVPEFIEIYNRSAHAISLRNIFLCARKADGQWGPIKRIVANSRLLMPGQWLALTTAADRLCGYYRCDNPENIQEVASLPAMPAESGSLLLLADSVLLDEVRYQSAFHFPLTGQPKGVALERREDGDTAKWISAAASAGYATPGYANSHPWREMADNARVALEPAIFCPDNAAPENRAVLQWTLPEAGWVGHVTVFTADGAPIRYLARNMTMGNKGNLYWDGFGENKVLLPPGIYIFLIEIFDLKGRVKRWKQSLVMARKLN